MLSGIMLIFSRKSLRRKKRETQNIHPDIKGMKYFNVSFEITLKFNAM